MLVSDVVRNAASCFCKALDVPYARLEEVTCDDFDEWSVTFTDAESPPATTPKLGYYTVRVSSAGSVVSIRRVRDAASTSSGSRRRRPMPSVASSEPT